MTSDVADPWGLLGLQPGASATAVSRAWRTQAARHHPDAGGDPENFRQLVAARDELLGATSATRVSVTVSVVRRRGPLDQLFRPLRRRIARRLHPRVH